MHVWHVALEPGSASVEALARTLDDVEAARAARFHFERDRRSFTVARGALRTLIGRYEGVSPREVTFAYGERGKPRLAGVLGNLRFNLSHSGRVALVAFTRSFEVGVDVEMQRSLDDLMGLARSVFSPRELAVLERLAPPAQRLAFYACWSRKEAFIKATGEGLARELASFDVSLAPGEPARLERVEGEPHPLRWSLYEIVVDKDHAGALVVEGAARAIQYFSFPF